MSAFIVIGVLWPFIVAALMLLATFVRADSDELARFLLVVSFLGTPAVARCVHHRLPGRWSEGARLGAAVLLAQPLVLAEVFLAGSALAFAMLSFRLSPA